MASDDAGKPGGDERLSLTFSQHVVRLQTLLDQAIAPALAEQRLTPAELDVLATLRLVGSPYQLRPTEISARLLLTAGGLSNVLRRLDARGLVSRIPDPLDGRSHKVCLTTDGIATAVAATTAVTAALQDLLAPVPSRSLLGGLHHLQSILGAIDDAPPAIPAFGHVPFTNARTGPD